MDIPVGNYVQDHFREVNKVPLVTINGTQLHTEKFGSGTPIIFIHPPLLSGRIFDYLAKQLCSSHTIIIFDIRGHGESPASNRPVEHRLIADDIAALLDYYEIEQAYICGYSTGSSVMLESLIAYPERFLGGIALTGMPEASDLFLRTRIWLAARLSGCASHFVTAAIVFGNADSLDTFRMLYQSSIGGSFDQISQYFESSLSYNCTELLPLIETPVLLLYGEKDYSFHPYARILYERLADSTLRLLPDQQHQLPFKSAGIVSRHIVSWIENLHEQESAGHYTQGVLQPIRS